MGAAGPALLDEAKVKSRRVCYGLDSIGLPKIGVAHGNCWPVSDFKRLHECRAEIWICVTAVADVPARQRSDA
jgi:hypothetical protein